MKKVLIPLAVFGVVIIGAIVFFFSERFENMNNRSEIAKYLAQAVEEDSLYATVGGETVKLDSGYSGPLLSILSWGRSERKREWAEPEGYVDKIVIAMGELTVTVYKLDTKPQADVFEKEIGGQKRWARLEKYNVFKRLEELLGE